MSPGPFIPPDEGGGALPPTTVAPSPPPTQQPPPTGPTTPSPTLPSPPIVQPGLPLLPPDSGPGGYTPLPPTTPTTPPPPPPPPPPPDDGGGSTQGQTIPEPGVTYIEIGPGEIIPAPPTTGGDSGGGGQTTTGGDEDGLPDLDGRFLAAVETLSGMPFVQYVRNGCDRRNLDDLAVFANAMAEGLHGGIGDDGTSFGPWNMHQGGALPKKYWTLPAYSPAVQAWTWSKQGIDWALDGMVKGGAAGKHGHDAVENIVRNFERPANTGGAIVVRDDYYDQLGKMGDPYSFLAQQAAGASGSGGGDSGPKTGSGNTGTGTVGAWRDLLDTSVANANKTSDSIGALKDRIREVVK